MKLSFAIPAHNEENYVGKCIDSIVEQMKDSNFDIEIVVVNNASTDKTKEVALGYAQVKVVDEMKKGLIYAREAGFRAASGDLIANVDSDTILTQGWIDQVFKEFLSDEKLVALSGPFIYYDLSRWTRTMVRVYYFIGYLMYLFNSTFRIGAMLQGGNFIVRRTALEKIGGYNPKFEFWGEDTEIACRLLTVGKVKFTFKLPIYTSGRRLVAEGIFKTAFHYSVNHFSTIFLKKPVSKSVNDFR